MVELHPTPSAQARFGRILRTDSSYVPAREQLRSHVIYQVLKRLVEEKAVPVELTDILFSIDLGL
jgi:hypothetical protein